MHTKILSVRRRWLAAGLLALLALPAAAETEFFPEKSIKYQGLIYLEGQPANPGLVGAAQMKVNRKGSFSAKYNTGYGKIRLKGDFDNEGQESKRVGGPDNNIGEAIMSIDPDTLVITGTIEFDNDYPGRDGYTLVFELQPIAKGGKKDPVPGTGKHEMILTVGGEDPASSSVVIEIKHNGKVKLKGRMPDGGKLKCKSKLCVDGRIPIYARWKKPFSVLLGWITVNERDGPVLTGELEWNARVVLDGGTLQTLVPNSVTLGL